MTTKSLGASASAPALVQGSSSSSSALAHTLNATAPPHPYLQTRLQAGGASSERINYTLSQKIFHGSDVPAEAREQKKAVNHSKSANILGCEPEAWNQSTIAPSEKKRHEKGLKRRLLQIRAGLHDEKVPVTGKIHSDEALNERRRYIYSLTGKGHIGPLNNKWFNPVDERGLSNHCVRDDWPDWNHSHSCHTKDDLKQANHRHTERDERRKTMMGSNSNGKLNIEAYVSPQQGTTNINAVLRERKLDYQELKEQFKHELKAEFPNASEERLQAVSQRLLKEKLLADEKLARFPANNEQFKPSTQLTSQDRRYRVYHHAGTWAFNEVEKRFTWSCCGSFSEDARGCEYKVVNPDAWCVLGFERRPGMAACSKAC
eukprot:TRINITY_DN64837_c0_g1_i1.p1 TRINITY_DN64837_c0_g1~~TRINITY_DN64837_c0_g1_i1.p1  ORF type:complete len:374 (-),score=81.25 TRINITY_DN64837_c0_g1_i1:39-1160(-)